VLILGVDPGAYGAIALYWPESDRLYVYDMPTHALRVNGKVRHRLDKHRLAVIVRTAAVSAKLAVIEDVHSMPAQGVASSFTFGFVAGAIQQCAVDNDIPIHLVAPAVWKRRFSLNADKDAARARASELMPKHAHWWARKKDDGRAESSLLAYYGAQHLANTRTV
jgi:crossover junction endodeoxyribonuclease RuvC